MSEEPFIRNAKEFVLPGNIKNKQPDKRNDLTGKKFNKLTAICVASKNHRREIKWLCICDCGNLTITRAGALTSGHTSSCGCHREYQQLKAVVTHGHTSAKSKHKDYYVWLSMRERCRNKNNPSYHLYGGRGISVCERWEKSFVDFIADMGERPSLDYSIDRYPNKDGNYEPGNCRWATKTEQNFNLRTNVWLVYNGERMVLAEFRRRIGQYKNSHVRNLLKKMSPEVVAEYYLQKSKQVV